MTLKSTETSTRCKRGSHCLLGPGECSSASSWSEFALLGFARNRACLHSFCFDGFSTEFETSLHQTRTQQQTHFEIYLSFSPQSIYKLPIKIYTSRIFKSRRLCWNLIKHNFDNMVYVDIHNKKRINKFNTVFFFISWMDLYK